MSSLAQQILDEVSKLDEARQIRVLNYIRSLEVPPQKRYSAIELMQLPTEERDKRIAESFALAANEDFEIFEANTENNFDDFG